MWAITLNFDRADYQQRIINKVPRKRKIMVNTRDNINTFVS